MALEFKSITLDDGTVVELGKDAILVKGQSCGKSEEINLKHLEPMLLDGYLRWNVSQKSFGRLLNEIWRQKEPYSKTKPHTWTTKQLLDSATRLSGF